MGLFSKKTKEATGKSIEVLRLNLDDFPEEALKLTYMDMMERYTDKPSSRLQKIMVHISKELNKRANTNIDEAQVEITVSKEEPKKTNLEQLTEKRIEQMVERKPKKQSIFTKPISQVIKKKEPQRESLNLNEDEQRRVAQLKAKKKKKSFGSFFKKKVPVFIPSKVTIAEEIQNHPNIQQEANKIRKLEEQLDSYEKEYGSVDKPAPVQEVQIEKPKKKLFSFSLPESPKKFSLKLPARKGYNLKGVELICECGHYLKAHQKGGESTGCNKCGCLRTIEQIAERQGVNLKRKDKSQKDEPAIEKQAKQLQSMTETKPVVNKPQPITQEQKEQSCTCEHKRSEHYEGKFCYTCNCSKFTPYPQDVKTDQPTEKPK